MNYLCIIYSNDGSATGTSAIDENTLKDGLIEEDHALFLAGKLLMASPLQGPETAVNIRYPNGVRTRTDGPYAETKEYVAGFMLISADNMEHAVEIALDTEFEGFGNFEIRPLLDEKHSKTGQDRSFFFKR